MFRTWQQKEGVGKVEFKVGNPADFLEMLKELSENRTDTKNWRALGVVPKELLKEHKQNGKLRNRLMEDMQARAEELALQAKRQIKEEFRERQESLDEKRDSFWNRVADQFGVENADDVDMRINPQTGLVSVEVTEDSKPNNLYSFNRDFPIQ